jgi:hypothetical protein
MTRKRLVAFVGYLAVSLLLMAFGFRYYFGNELMSYHLVALGVPWESLPDSVRFLFGEFMHGVGAGFMTVSLAMLVLLFVPFRRGERWAECALPVIGLTINGLLVTMLCSIMSHTAAEPPMGMILASSAVLVVAAGLTLLPCRCCSKE